MRLWHEQLIPKLPRMQLLGQHRECTAMRGLGWGVKHSVVNYAWNHSMEMLVAYHFKIIDEMLKRGYSPDPIWSNPQYRGKRIGFDYSIANERVDYYKCFEPVYAEHNAEYLTDCLQNLERKNITIKL